MGLSTTGRGAGHTNALIAAWNCLLYVGGLFGALSYPWLSNRFGRRIPIFASGVSALVGGALQAGEVNAAMLCVARVIIGTATGLILSGVPLYQAEISPPSARGLMVGLHGKHSNSGSILKGQ